MAAKHVKRFKRFSSICYKEVTMSDIDEKLIVKLGQRITEQTEVLRVIGNKRYARLITFRALSDAEPIAAKAKKAIRA
jgi:hypothetical protein